MLSLAIAGEVAALASAQHGDTPAPYPDTLLDLVDGWSRHTRGSGTSLPALEQQLLEEAVRRANGNLSSAARTLGITRAQLAYRLQRRAGESAKG
ncbi:helix-turn-helix domain-containing protein [Burkholderia pyrrocinia]|uniref:helix-turn-helix domain-containing protein n=1 Tax=Burkholderia pyrrocinia TaxID=60550 RepID=UPI0038B4CB8E